MPKAYIFLLAFCWLYTYAHAQLPNPLSLNTAADGLNATLAIGSSDTNWYASYGNAAGPVTAFSPTVVVGNCAPGFWYDSPFLNANWIAYDFGSQCKHDAYGCIDLYFRRQITLPATDPCGQPINQSYCLAMDFFADNSVYEITVNGKTNYQYNLPYDPYNYNGYHEITSVNLCMGWQAGGNTILVHIKSCPFAEGFLAQGNVDIMQHYYQPYFAAATICAGENMRGHSTTGLYVDTLAALSGCDSMLTLDLHVIPTKSTTIDTIICAGSSHDFYGVTVAEPGVYSTVLPAFSGCDSVITWNLKFAQHPFLGPDTTLCMEDNYLLTGPTEQTTWFDHTVSKTKIVRETGDYWATYPDTNGCAITDSVFIRFKVKSFIPNIFSPNDDGENDCFQPDFSDTDFNSYRLSVFDRWGNLVFLTTEPKECWSGTFRGKSCAAGVYLYFIEIATASCRQILKGDITLIR